MSVSPLHAEILSGLSWRRYSACCHNCCEFLGAAALLCVWRIPFLCVQSLPLSYSLKSYSLPPTSSTMIPVPWEMKAQGNVLFGT